MMNAMKRTVPDPDCIDSPAEEIRRRYRYRQLLLRSNVRLPRRVLIGLVGPDCAYHLYRWEEAGPEAEPDSSSPGD